MSPVTVQNIIHFLWGQARLAVKRSFGKRFWLAQLLLLNGTASTGLQAQTNSWLLNSFETSADLAVISTNGVSISLATTGATLGQHSGCINMAAGKSYPGISFTNSVAFTNQDWHAFAGLTFDLLNTNATPLKNIYIKVYDSLNNQQASVPFPANAFGTVVAMFPQAAAAGMNQGPPLAYTNALSAATKGSILNWSNIISFQIFISTPTNATTLFIDNLRLVGLPPTNGWVDAYGQYTGYDWTNKIRQQSDFTNQLNQEQQWLTHSNNGAPTDRDRYGGWLTGPQLTNNGFFRTARVDGGKEIPPGATNSGRWCLVTPTGRIFYSLGINCMDYNETTPVSGRANLFTWLPGSSDPLYSFAMNGTANFYGMNLYRKYGPNWLALSHSNIGSRLNAWGINTIGNWSNPQYYNGTGVPYTVSPWCDWSQAATFVARADGSKMPDPFDPRFLTCVDTGISGGTSASKNDPWCLGYFVDNEMVWSTGSQTNQVYALPVAVLTNTAALPAKTEFTWEMQQKYSTIGALNSAWNVSIASWSDFSNQPVTLPTTWTNNPGCIADLSAFLSSFASQYFSIVRSKLKQFAPNQLYLGCRFASRPSEVFHAAAQFCDVVSINYYVASVDSSLWSYTSTLGKPCLFSEFHFGALDRGMFSPGLVPTLNQAGRGQGYQNYLHSVMALPAFVGCHWFQYHDEPLLGRSDGENYNIGFVSNTDTPYWELIGAVQQISASIYTNIYGALTTTIVSDQGSPNPSGVITNTYGSLISCSVASPITNGLTQYFATGWTGSGSVGSGTGTNVSFSLTNNTTLTWLWQTNLWLNLNTLGN